MAFTLPTVIPLGSESRVSHTPIYTGFDELYNNNDSRDRGGDNYHDLWVSIKQMVWGKYNPHLSLIRRYSRFRFNINSPHSWRSILTRTSDTSSKSGTVTNRNRKRNRHYFYYGIIISILAIGNPSYASEGETNNTSNPVAAATGNVTNQAVQFQNNGAPSRQVIGPNISCNGATMTFSPFYMGNHTTPFDDAMAQQSYTVAENWGGQINFMVPLDGSLVERCKAAADRQVEKMRLDYELVRVLKCAELQQKGFMLRPKTRVYNMCQDVIPISAFKKELKEAKQNPLIDPKYNDTTNQANPFRIPKERLSETTRSRFTFGLRKKN